MANINPSTLAEYCAEVASFAAVNRSGLDAELDDVLKAIQIFEGGESNPYREGIMTIAGAVIEVTKAVFANSDEDMAEPESVESLPFQKEAE
jgi:hypothetical protein